MHSSRYRTQEMCYLTNFREMFSEFSKNLSNSAQIFHETVIKLYILFTTGLLVKQLLLDAHDNQDFRFVGMFRRICVFIGWQCTHRVLPVGPVAQLVERDWRPEDRGFKSHWTFFLYFSSSFLLSTFLPSFFLPSLRFSLLGPLLGLMAEPSTICSTLLLDF